MENNKPQIEMIEKSKYDELFRDALKLRNSMYIPNQVVTYEEQEKMEQAVFNFDFKYLGG